MWLEKTANIFMKNVFFNHNQIHIQLKPTKGKITDDPISPKAEQFDETVIESDRCWISSSSSSWRDY